MRVVPLKEETRSVRTAMSNPREYNTGRQKSNLEAAYSKDEVGNQTFRNGINRRYSAMNRDKGYESKESKMPLLTAKDC